MVLEIDRGRKRIRLGLKQLQPTSADEYIAEHKVGDMVTGRVVDSKKKASKVDLGDGVFASCRKVAKAPEASTEEEVRGDRPDLSALTEMLAAKWKAGSVSQGGEQDDELSPGQVRRFRIVALDAQQKKIELEVAE
jgi:small subunit ribosomal protein S1